MAVLYLPKRYPDQFPAQVALSRPVNADATITHTESIFVKQNTAKPAAAEGKVANVQKQ
jgi:hypothetical protein